MAAKRKAKERVQNYLSLSPEIEVELLDIDYLEIEPLEIKVEPLELELMEIERLSLWEGSLSTNN